MSETSLHKPEGWTARLKVDNTSLRIDEPVHVEPVLEGIDPSKVVFNYVWSLEGSWDDGNWGSTLESTGKPTKETFWEFLPKREGRYHLFCDVTDADGGTLTVNRWINVAGPEGFMRPPLPSPDAETIIGVNDVSMVFNIASEQFNSLKEYFLAMAKGELKFKEFRALDHISFEVKRGEAFGLVGTNGSGKSTMLKVIAGVLEATEGSCEVRGTIAPLIELGAGFDMELTAKENIYLNGALLGYKKEFIDDHFDDIVSFAELENFMDMPLKNYSSGMVARIAFAIATITEPDILIVDETLSVGDFLFQQKCERRIKELVEADGVTVLLVSHSLELVERICDRVCWIEKGKQRMLGPTDDVCEAYRNLER